VLGAVTLITALLDRLTHKSYVLLFDGESFALGKARKVKKEIETNIRCKTSQNNLKGEGNYGKGYC
jgi:hypothetical protein